MIYEYYVNVMKKKLQFESDVEKEMILFQTNKMPEDQTFFRA